MKEEERVERLRRLAQQIAQVIPVVDKDHFVSCPVCGQFYDVRDFVEVYYHDHEPHEPMKGDA